MNKVENSGTTIDRVIAMGLVPWLRAHGFARKGRSFTRPAGHVIDTAHVQASQWNTPDRASFYVNIAVDWPAIYPVWTGQSAPSNPALAPCFLRTRVHTLAGNQGWDVDPTVDEAALSEELVAALEEQSGFWEQNHDLAGVLQQLEARERPWQGTRVWVGTPEWLVKATLLAYFGRADEAEATIDAAAAAQSRRTHAMDFSVFRARLGQIARHP